MTALAEPAREGLRAAEVLALIERRIEALGLDLSGLHVVTEAATGAYAFTPVIAAMAGARSVVAVGRDTPNHGRFEDAAAAVGALASDAGVADRIEAVRALAPEMLARCDILTNSGHLRPIARDVIERLPREAVVALMFEAWEFRAADLDLAACRARGVRVAAVNERHPAVGVFPFLGPLAVRLLHEAGRPPEGRRVALLCDNPFAPFVRAGLEEVGASVGVFARPEEVTGGGWDTVLLALDPNHRPALGEAELAALGRAAPGALLAQFWGDVDRGAARRHFADVRPLVAPREGHMAILLSALGPEPIVRLQAGGLSAAERVRRGAATPPGGVAEPL